MRVEFGLPAGFFFAGEFGEVGEGAGRCWGSRRGGAEGGVAEAVAGEGLVGVGGVFAPGLGAGSEVVAQFGAAGVEEGRRIRAWLGE